VWFPFSFCCVLYNLATLKQSRIRPPISNSGFCSLRDVYLSLQDRRCIFEGEKDPIWLTSHLHEISFFLFPAAAASETTFVKVAGIRAFGRPLSSLSLNYLKVGQKKTKQPCRKRRELNFVSGRTILGNINGTSFTFPCILARICRDRYHHFIINLYAFQRNKVLRLRKLLLTNPYFEPKKLKYLPIST
jgi:hypothetical protein